MKPTNRILITFFLLFTPMFSSAGDYFQIKVVDQETGRGVPLIEVKTVNEVPYFTDSNGIVAFNEPGLMDQDVFFHVSGHGYSYPKDGFGYSGLRLHPTAGGEAVIKVKRENIAERLYRITGQGIYSDSIKTGAPVPLEQPALNSKVVGQDSTLAAIYNDKIYWFWGDTSRAAYPLGNFRTTGATSRLPSNGGLSPEVGVNLNYFESASGFTQEMFPEFKENLIWIDGLLTINDHSGKERLICHYSRLESISKLLEHGLAVFDDDREAFIKIKEFKLDETWQAPRYHPIRVKEDGADYFYFPGWFTMTRVKANYGSLLDASQYEAYTCLEPGASYDGENSRIITKDSKPQYAWRKAEPTAGWHEKEWADAGLLKIDDAHFLPVDINSGAPVGIHGSSVKWNPYRKKWVLIGVQQFGTSVLGEVWYSEADHPTGPWRKAVKIVTHNNYTFYNPVHHAFFDEQDGRFIYFEGTYTKTFSGNDVATPRYDYNQIMYRLDLDRADLNQAKR
ncbi:MAG: hypothetical protein P9L94_00025 [Candidatus Hinthialibacter antarcticus]|nr:hypothetical protein [Candidatus Hinthialibacter antarcticus]